MQLMKSMSIPLIVKLEKRDSGRFSIGPLTELPEIGFLLQLLSYIERTSSRMRLCLELR